MTKTWIRITDTAGVVRYLNLEHVAEVTVEAPDFARVLVAQQAPEGGMPSYEMSDPYEVAHLGRLMEWLRMPTCRCGEFLVGVTFQDPEHEGVTLCASCHDERTAEWDRTTDPFAADEDRCHHCGQRGCVC